MSRVYTIGHSTHESEAMVELLRAHAITAVADVRSSPYSRFNPQFNRETLSASLKAAGLAYVFLGHELGARSEDSSCYVGGKVQYDLVARTELFKQGLDRIVQGCERERIALMCAEKDPLKCHRTILVSRHVVARGVAVSHILEDGRLESHDEALCRLFSELGMDGPELFRSRDERIVDAYRRRGDRIAYTARGPHPEESVREGLR